MIPCFASQVRSSLPRFAFTTQPLGRTGVHMYRSSVFVAARTGFTFRDAVLCCVPIVAFVSILSLV